jgi:hypothetical protein
MKGEIPRIVDVTLREHLFRQDVRMFRKMLTVLGTTFSHTTCDCTSVLFAYM